MIERLNPGQRARAAGLHLLISVVLAALAGLVFGGPAPEGMFFLVI